MKQRLEMKLGLISCGLEFPAETSTEQRERERGRGCGDQERLNGTGAAAIGSQGDDNRRARLTASPSLI